MPLIAVRKRPGQTAANIVGIANGTPNRSEVVAHVPNSLGIIGCGDAIFGDHHRQSPRRLFGLIRTEEHYTILQRCGALPVVI